MWPRCRPTPAAACMYMPASLPRMVITAQVIVLGDIVAVEAQHVLIRVVRLARGGAVGDTLRVEQAANACGAARWAPYAAGQRVLLF